MINSITLAENIFVILCYYFKQNAHLHQLNKFLFIILFYRQFRLCITALQATPAQGKAHTPIILIILYHTLAEKARVIFRLRRSDMIATAIVILKPYSFSDILFATKLA